MDILFGIDYGSKFTGNTVIAIFQDGEILFMQVDKNVDADQFIYNATKHFKPTSVFIDCPLSLPGRYTGISDCDSYHFRKADMELRAMSPMFLGGMAARAMELKDRLTRELEVEVIETYPKILALEFKLKARGYKGSILGLKDCKKALAKHLNEDWKVEWSDISSWHHFDALLALLSALRYKRDQAMSFGMEEEGRIVV